MFIAVEIIDWNVRLFPVYQGLAKVHSIFMGLVDEWGT